MENQKENILTKSYLEYKPLVPLWCILVMFIHAIGLYFLWSHMEGVIDDLPEMLVYAWDSSGQFALAWHASAYLDDFVYAAILVYGIGLIIMLFLRLIPLLWRCKHAVKDKIYCSIYRALTIIPLIFSGLIVYMFFTAIALKRYNMLLVCGLALLIIVYLIIVIVKNIRYYKNNKIEKS